MKKCCGCIDMRTGVIYIGTFGLILSIMAIIAQFAILLGEKHLITADETGNTRNSFSFVIVVGIVVCVFKLVSDCLLIVGAMNKTAQEVSVWLVINLCAIIFGFINSVFAVAFAFIKKEYEIHLYCILAILCITNVFFIYAWNQVYIFSRQLELNGQASQEEIIQNEL